MFYEVERVTLENKLEGKEDTIYCYVCTRVEHFPGYRNRVAVIAGLAANQHAAWGNEQSLPKRSTIPHLACGEARILKRAPTEIVNPKYRHRIYIIAFLNTLRRVIELIIYYYSMHFYYIHYYYIYFYYILYKALLYS